jgi:uncharacterized protein YijF (DUF1287 family)
MLVRKLFHIFLLAHLLTFTSACQENPNHIDSDVRTGHKRSLGDSLNEESLSPSCKTFVDHVKWQSTQDVAYDPSYFTISYPNGDVPANKGVCVDVPIRGLRTIGIDLQKLVHEDILRSQNSYRITRIDKNIDHRRCTNLIVYFKRKNQTVPVSDQEEDYHPGDLVFWDIARGHVGVVSDVKVPGTQRYYMVHNICCGPKMEDFLFAAPIVCHVPFEKIK